ncbi:hypothetical protein M407DRAFT_185711 [Tulasnella calospora MUT 4182]|uniref:Uncharacterized protein n=1 Tax=Tulasnella calospora MUT 4182 TaxID=1051891 RepID=A0A0C3Q1Q2_9AGAM|nr:hypothetical protein M407DRAFT_185711 [Tulasnella calospora MUT 4182]
MARRLCQNREITTEDRRPLIEDRRPLTAKPPTNSNEAIPRLSARMFLAVVVISV